MKNEKATLRKDKRAVSPVIGVILMVAITVILAAVIAAFVFGYGAPEASPQASLNIVKADATTEKVTLEHRGGDSIVFSETVVIVTQDIGTPATKANGGALVAVSGFEAGSSAVFEPGELAIQTTATAAPGLVAGKTCRVEILHVPSEKIIFSGTATAVL